MYIYIFVFSSIFILFFFLFSFLHILTFPSSLLLTPRASLPKSLKNSSKGLISLTTKTAPVMPSSKSVAILKSNSPSEEQIISVIASLSRKVILFLKGTGGSLSLYFCSRGGFILLIRIRLCRRRLTRRRFITFIFKRLMRLFKGTSQLQESMRSS